MARGKEVIKTDVENEIDESMERADQIIMRHIGRKPVSEIANLIGWKPEQVLRRKTELISNIDVLTVQEKRVKLMYELDELSAEARERAQGTIDEYYAGMLNSSVSAMKTVLVELARMEKQDSGAVEQLNQLRLREIGRLVEKAVMISVREIATKYDLEEDELMEIFQENLVEAAREMDDEIA